MTYETYNFFQTATEKFELCKVNLTAGKTYTVLLAPTANYGYYGEFWVEVTHMLPDSDDDEWHGRGTTDFITKKIYVTFTPQYSDTYAILIMKYEPKSQSDSLHQITLQVYEGIYLETWIIVVLSLVGVVVGIAACRALYKRYTGKKGVPTTKVGGSSL